MAYELRIERETSEYPSVVTDISEFLVFKSPSSDGSFPTISLPERSREGLPGLYSHMIGWHWYMGDRHTIGMHDPESQTSYWITQENFTEELGVLESIFASITGKLPKKGKRLNIRTHHPVGEDDFIGPVIGRVSRHEYRNYILVKGEPSELIEDVLKIENVVCDLNRS